MFNFLPSVVGSVGWYKRPFGKADFSSTQGTGKTGISYAGDPAGASGPGTYGAGEELMQYIASLGAQQGARRDALLYGNKGARGASPGGIFARWTPNYRPGTGGGDTPSGDGSKVLKHDLSYRDPNGNPGQPIQGTGPANAPAGGGPGVFSSAVEPQGGGPILNQDGGTDPGPTSGHIPVGGGGTPVGGGTVNPNDTRGHKVVTAGGGTAVVRNVVPGGDGDGGLDYTAGAPEGILGQYETWRNSSGFDPATLAAIRNQTSTAARGASDAALADINQRYAGTGNEAGFYAGRGAVGRGAQQAMSDAAQKTAIANYSEGQRLHELGTAGEQNLYNSESSDLNNYLAQLGILTGRKRGISTSSDTSGSSGGIDLGQLLALL